MAVNYSEVSLSKIIYFLQRGFVNFYCYLFDTALLIFRNKTINNYEKKVVLILKFDAIGDFILWTACAEQYRKLYPKQEYHLVLLGNSIWKELAMNMGYFDEVWDIDRKKFMLNISYRISVWKKYFQNTFHTVIYHANSREFASGDAMIRMSHSTNKIAQKSDLAIDAAIWHKISNHFYTKVLLSHSDNVHELEKNFHFINVLSNEKIEILLPNIVIKNCPCDEIDLPENYFVVFPGARVSIRKWNEQNYSSIIDKISLLTNWKCVVCGGKEDIEFCNKILSHSKHSIINLCGKTTLLQLVGIVRKARFLIGNETSGVHIATAVQTPSICILGGGHFERFVPYPGSINSKFKPVPVFEKMPCFNCNWNCVYQLSKQQTVPCINQISVEKVWIETEKIIYLLQQNHS